jgi:threonine synthase
MVPSTADGGATSPPDLRCPECGSGYAAGADEPWRCDCGAPLEFAAAPLPGDGPPAPGDLDRARGLWAFDAFMPVERTVTLGEGWTPLVDVPAWDAAFKLEYVFPTGSFKDRGATTTLSRAARLDVDRVVEDSSGNAGAAIATYAARAGVDATIYVPADAKPAKVAAIERAGADLERVEGGRQAVTDACIAAAESAPPRAPEDAGGRRPRAAGEWYYASHAWHPAFLAGTATFAMEVCAQRGWAAPDAVVSPVGHGTLFLGAYRGFIALQEAGWIDEVPRLLAAQAAGVAPVVAALGGDEGDADDANDVADGIQIAEPVRGDEIREAIRATGGDAIAVGADATRAALDRLRRGGFSVEPTCAVAPAALEQYREAGVLDDEADVVVPLTGSGLKDVP